MEREKLAKNFHQISFRGRKHKQKEDSIEVTEYAANNKANNEEMTCWNTENNREMTCWETENNKEIKLNLKI